MKINKYVKCNLFHEPDLGGQPGAGPGDTFANAPEPGAGAQPTNEPAAQPTAPILPIESQDALGQEPAPGAAQPGIIPIGQPVDYAAITQAVLAGLPQAQQPQQAPRQWTQAEINSHFNVYEATDADLASITAGGPEGVAAFNKVLQAAVKQASTIAYYAAKKEVSDFESRATPGLNAAQEVQRNAAKGRFFESHTDLKGADELLELATDMLQREGGFANLRTEKDVHKAIADRAKSLIGKVSGAAVPGSPGTKPPMAPLGGGRQAGGAAPAGGGSPSSAADPRSVYA